MWFKWFWNVYCTRKGSHIHYFEETSDPIHKLDFEAKEKVHPSWNRLLHDEIKLWGLGFRHDHYNLPSIFSFEEEKKSLTWKRPDKSSKRRRHSAPALLASAAKKQIFIIFQCQQIYMNLCRLWHVTHIFHLIPDGRQHTQPFWFFGSSSRAGCPSSCSTNCPLALSSNISATIPLWFGCFPSRHIDKRNPSKPCNRK